MVSQTSNLKDKTMSEVAAPPVVESQPVVTPPVTPPANESLLPPITPPAAPPADDAPAWAAKVPEKFHVKGADGKVDIEATLLKQADSYTSLEKLKGQAAPSKPDDYTFTPPEEFKDLKLDDALSANFRERAHKAGFSQAQYEFVMGEYLSLVPEVLNSVVQASAAEARQELSKVWTTPAEFEMNINNAARAVSALPESIREDVQARFGRDPLFLQAIAHYGSDMREDRPPVNPDGSNGGGETLEQLMANPAYSNPKDPQHAAISARAQALAERMAPG